VSVRRKAPLAAPQASGIQKSYVDALGKRHAPPRETVRVIERAMTHGRPAGGSGVLVVRAGDRVRVGPADIRLEDGGAVTVDGTLPPDLPLGYHQLVGRRGAPSRLIVAPARCYLPPDFVTWGWAIQLYAARSRRSWGIGDLADLRWLGRWAREQGAGIALINPLAAPAPTLPQQASPYFPTSRRFRSPLYLRIEEIEGARAIAVVRQLARTAHRLNRDRLIDRDEIFTLKSRALEAIWEKARGHTDGRFEQFRREQGGLREFATFCALAEKFGGGWRRWPPEYQHPQSSAVARITRSARIRDRIDFHEWVQYQVDRQLGRASKVMPVMQDLPIGFDAGGADGWAFQDVLAHGISVGAPPDEFNTKGQNWGLPPFVPDRLRAAGYEPFVQTIRACLRHSGGLRIDHVMGLFRLFWIPEGCHAREGAYVQGHPEDLLAIVALESQRARAVIVGEDLGTVEESTREQLAAHAILSYRLLWFEKMSPARYPEGALAAVTTHDLPTVAGLWSDYDLEVQHELGLAPNDAGTREIRSRVQRMARVPASAPNSEVVARVHETLAKAPSRILTATLDDAMAVEERPNMPATSDEWPNWRLALPEPIESLKTSRLAKRIARALRRRRRLDRS
jgi:4-alpha-glucanotransferase